MKHFNRTLLKRIWYIGKGFWVGEDKWKGLGWLALLLLGLAGVNGLNVVLNFVGGTFMQSLQAKDADAFFDAVIKYGGVFVVGIPLMVYYGWVRSKLGLAWRRWLTKNLTEKYFQNRAFYRLSQSTAVDNPDERLADDVSGFISGTLTLFLSFADSIITLIAFSAILWSISHMLMWVALAYSVIGTLVIGWYGQRLVRLNYDQSKLEANFRFSIIRVRTNAEQIAFYKSEKREKSGIFGVFEAALQNSNAIIGFNRNLGFLTTFYSYAINLVPYVILAPFWFRGEIDFGNISQGAMAFGQVLAATSLFVDGIRTISGLAANVERLGGFVESVSAPESNGGIQLLTNDKLVLTDVTVTTPTGRPLAEGLSTMATDADGGMLIVGPSGAGKTTLLKVLAGLHSYGKGEVIVPTNVMFVPQRPYLPKGTLRANLTYPSLVSEIPDNELLEMLELVNLNGLAERIGGIDAELFTTDSEQLSLGEQQRLAFARLLLAKPKFALLDEATSALDVANEARMYKLLQEYGITPISVGHRPTLTQFHNQVLQLDGEGGWKVVTSTEYGALEAAASQSSLPVRLLGQEKPVRQRSEREL